MDTDTAQVDPYEYTTKVYEKSGAQQVIDSVSKLVFDDDGSC